MVTIIVRYKVLSANEKKFNIWYAEMQHIVSQFPGFISKEFFPSNQENDYITTILRFDNMENANNWMHSEQRLSMLQKASARILTNIEEGIHTKNVFWFNTKSSIKKKWKQVLVTFIVIFPLSLLIPRLITDLITLLSDYWLLRSAISVLLLVVLMVFFVMPFMIKITRKWLE